MVWSDAGFEVKDIIEDEYFFAGPDWQAQRAKRFVLNVTRTNQIIECAHYAHLNENNAVVNVAFEPSASYGCAIGCLFCASGGLYPITSLNKEEIVGQITNLICDYEQNYAANYSVRRDVFYAGIGEPTLMPDQIIGASEIVHNLCPEIGFKMSTMGAVPNAIAKFAESSAPWRSLQFSIPHWDEKNLRYLFAGMKHYDLPAALAALKEFSQRRPECNIKFNYVGMKGYNSTKEDLAKIINLIKERFGSNFDLKLSCLNPTAIGQKNNLATLSKQELDNLAIYARSLGLKSVYTFGPMSPKKLGCGQLAANYKRTFIPNERLAAIADSQ